MHGFVLTGTWQYVMAVLAALAELEWEMPDLMSQLDCKVLRFK